MSKYPNFERHSYQVQQELGKNSAGGRVTYLASRKNTRLPVVIKQFKFAQPGSNWAEYDAHQREIQMMRQLNHFGIPRYLDSFETSTGFCLVQEYKQAPSLAEENIWKAEEIKEIALAVLEILVYLQQQQPPVIHRDIKPENILVDRRSVLKVYLVDFGFARQASKNAALSSVVKGTLGFMPPEQLFNQPLTKASDLYGLGATLICLLTGTKSTDIGNLIDQDSRFNFRHLVPEVSRQFVRWLEKMVSPNPKNRYPSAAVALDALRPIRVVASNSGIEVLGSLIKEKAPAALVALSTLSLVAGVGITFGWRPPVVRHLLSTGECSACNLEQVKLEGANLVGADLAGAMLENANLESAYLVDANLKSANLESASLVDANLYGANLEGANLRNAKLKIAKLEGANLWGAKLEGANFWGAKLRGANLWGANLNGAYLGGANLDGAYLGGSNLEGANLEGVKLEDANLEGANLKGANLAGANLKGANLDGANLDGANLKRAIMPDGTVHD